PSREPRGCRSREGARPRARSRRAADRRAPPPGGARHARGVPPPGEPRWRADRAVPIARLSVRVAARRVVRLAAASFLLAMIAGCSATRPPEHVTIVADPGRFGTIERAAAAEDSIDWWRPDNPDRDACTESFAATELARFLPAAFGIPADS